MSECKILSSLRPDSMKVHVLLVVSINFNRQGFVFAKECI